VISESLHVDLAHEEIVTAATSITMEVPDGTDTSELRATRAGETYTIRIRRWSGTDPTWYGIAWTVTGGLRIEFPLDLEVARVRS
jgi:hypothetical protein